MQGTIKKESIVKLTSASLLMLAAQEKVRNYMEKNAQVFQQIIEDEEAMAFFSLYYEENEEELEQAAAESLYTSNEVEALFLEWRDL